jgi:hypothetical protein
MLLAPIKPYYSTLIPIKPTYKTPVSALTLAVTAGVGVAAADTLTWYGMSVGGVGRMIIAGTGWVAWDASYLLYTPEWTYKRYILYTTLIYTIYYLLYILYTTHYTYINHPIYTTHYILHREFSYLDSAPPFRLR